MANNEQQSEGDTNSNSETGEQQARETVCGSEFAFASFRSFHFAACIWPPIWQSFSQSQSEAWGSLGSWPAVHLERAHSTGWPPEHLSSGGSSMLVCRTAATSWPLWIDPKHTVCSLQLSVFSFRPLERHSTRLSIIISGPKAARVWPKQRH